MLSIAYELAAALLLPSNFVALLGLLGVAALLLRWRGTASWLLVTGVLLLCVAGWSPLGPALLMKLENRFPVPQLPGAVTGIVMLGGAEEAHITADRHVPTLNNNAERVFETAVLARRYPNARILLSGGGGHVVAGQYRTEAEIAQSILVDLGIGAERIEMERRSQTTFENAAQSVALAKPQPSDTWLLVTSAYNMPRAVASFRSVGFPVIPYPVDYRTKTADLLLPLSTIAEGLDISDNAVHEWLGLATYRLTGKTQTFFPAAN